ncbi:MAG: murein L,D-transpeptidase catalytic domain family protein [Flavobacteriales bacterium]|nr:murein L,D-transpeptidase catalytic domain family protein [Flavobacteriales bacterium]
MIETMVAKCICILFLSFGLFSCAQSDAKHNNLEQTRLNSDQEKETLFNNQRNAEYCRQKQLAAEYIVKNKRYNPELVFLLDMRRPSGQFRFFVHDLKNDSIIHRALVAHGSGSELLESDSLMFSNIPNSYQSSLGKYRIGGKYMGNFGESYKLHGLDMSNSNAFKRYIVLHPYSAVPDEEQDYPIILSLGCPMVSNSFMNILHGVIANSPKSILMIMYY